MSRFLISIVGATLLIFGCQSGAETKTSEVSESKIMVDGVTNLVIDQNFELVKGQCTACHSAMLITQNSASREGWEQMIRWMQKDQGLWDLGESEDKILDYLSKNYGPQKKGRRTPLTNIEWYYLDN